MEGKQTNIDAGSKHSRGTDLPPRTKWDFLTKLRSCWAKHRGHHVENGPRSFGVPPYLLLHVGAFGIPFTVCERLYVHFEAREQEGFLPPLGKLD